ncbi:MAG: hypothetical protein WBX22_06465 [Silvibacterium sp.]|jgi:hypothetical protein
MMPAPPVVIKEEREWIAAIDAQIDRLQQARAILTGGKSTTRRHHHMSPEARARISAAQKKRWAKTRKLPGKHTPPTLTLKRGKNQSIG